MPEAKTRFRALIARQRLVVVAIAIPFVLSAAPARAQDFFGLFRLFSQPVAPVPTYQPYDYRTVPEFERPRVPRRARIVEQPAIKMPLKPKAPGEVTNPVPELLADSTLRAGDMVMFPDGLRVFAGRPGSQHTLADFEPVVRARKTVPSATRKLVATYRPGVNPAWSAARAGKVAAISGVGTTRSVSRSGR
jgi:hypothetical protein